MKLGLVCCLRRDLPTALYRADDGYLLGAASPKMLTTRAVTFSPFTWLSANVRLIHFDDTSEEPPLFGLGHGLANLHGDPPSGILVHLEVSGKLKG